MIIPRIKKAVAAVMLALLLMLPIGYGSPLLYAEMVQQTNGIVSSAPNTVKSSGTLHAGPSPLYPVVTEIDEGAEITLIGQTPYRRWFQLENEAWISIDMLVETPPQLDYAIAPIPEEDVRAGETSAGSDSSMPAAATDDAATADNESMPATAAATDNESMADGEEAPDDEATDDEAVADDESMADEEAATAEEAMPATAASTDEEETTTEEATADSGSMDDEEETTDEEVAADSGSIDDEEETADEEAMPAAAAPTNEETANIVEVAGSADGFSTLVAAIEAADLVDTLQGDGPFTVLAPTDEAFEVLPEGALDALVADPEQLAAVLLYHVIPNERIASEDMSDGWAIETAEGSTVEVVRAAGGLSINESRIIVADIAASNGIIHVINNVLLPPSYEAPASEEAAVNDEAATEEAATEETVAEAAVDEEAAIDEAVADEAVADEAAVTDEAATDEPAPEPIVSVPSDWTVIEDSTRGYSFAMPPGWTELNLRGAQLVSLATMFGQGAAATDLQTFLDTEDGQSIGIVAITDISNTFMGGLPTLLNVSVIGAPGATQERLLTFVNQLLEQNAAMLGDVNIENLDTATTNNLPSVVGTGTADLSSVGIRAQAGIKIAGLIYQEKIYMITLGTQLDNWAEAEPTFDEIIGTLKPE